MAEGFQSDAFQADAFEMGITTPIPTSIVPNTPTARSAMGGLYDQLLHPLTLDYVDSYVDDNGQQIGEPGGQVDTADSRTIVMAMIELRLGKSYYTPGDGTILGDALESGNLTPEEVEADVTRAMRILEADGVISDFSMRIGEKNASGQFEYYTDEAGRLTPVLSWIDQATGTPVDMTYAPFTGGA